MRCGKRAWSGFEGGSVFEVVVVMDTSSGPSPILNRYLFGYLLHYSLSQRSIRSYIYNFNILVIYFATCESCLIYCSYVSDCEKITIALM